MLMKSLIVSFQRLISFTIISSSVNVINSDLEMQWENLVNGANSQYSELNALSVVSKYIDCTQLDPQKLEFDWEYPVVTVIFKERSQPCFLRESDNERKRAG